MIDEQGGGPDGDGDLWRGLPQTVHDPATPEGRIEQVGKMAAGLRTPRQAWRGTVARLGSVIVVVAAVAVLVALIVSSR